MDDEEKARADVELKLSRWWRNFITRDPDTFFLSESARKRHKAMKREMLAKNAERAYEKRHKKKQP